MKNETAKNCVETSHLQILDCGTGEYRKILQLQRELVEKRRNNEIANTVIIVEHTAVITLGARQSANKLLVSAEELVQRNIDVVDIRRGGGTTAHNPGQLVFYPILDLTQMSLGISEYIRQLESIGKELLEQSGLECAAKKGYPGLWVGDKKIASIGVRVSRFITYHGMAININNDLTIFDYVTPCGLDNIQMTSLLKETGKEHSMSLIKGQLAQILVRYFS
ncbi:MAG: lipoyl(octanoyl) transferase LipB [Sedimentisphaerales bacterium]